MLMTRAEATEKHCATAGTPCRADGCAHWRWDWFQVLGPYGFVMTKAPTWDDANDPNTRPVGRCGLAGPAGDIDAAIAEVKRGRAWDKAFDAE